MFNPADFDPSKLDPKTISALTGLMRELPPAQIFKMQGLMQKMMSQPSDPALIAQMAEFERDLPPGFKEKLVQTVAGSAGAIQTQSVFKEPSTSVFKEPSTTTEARLTILQAVSLGTLSPQAALEVLFPHE